MQIIFLQEFRDKLFITLQSNMSFSVLCSNFQSLLIFPFFCLREFAAFQFLLREYSF